MVVDLTREQFDEVLQLLIDVVYDQEIKANKVKLFDCLVILENEGISTINIEG